jgi:two-component system, NarL family, response regulator DevR
VTKIRVGLVDDHALLRLGLRTLIDDEADMEVVGEADSTASALQMVERDRPQVILMDIRLPGDSGLEATRQITARYPQTRIVMLTSFADEDLVVGAIRAGAVGYILKEVGNQEVLRAVRLAAAGGSVLDAGTTSRLLSRVRDTEQKADADAFRDLSERELDVLYEISQGKTNAEIATSLNLSEKTARNYVSSILEKLHLANRIELATYAIKHNLAERMKHE